MLGLRYVTCGDCGRVTATPTAAAEVVCGRCESDAVRDLPADAADDADLTYFASSMRRE